MSNPPHNYYSIRNSNYRYFGKDLTNIEAPKPHHNPLIRDFKNSSQNYQDQPYSQYLRNSRFLKEETQQPILNKYQSYNDEQKAGHQLRPHSSCHRRTSSVGIPNSQFLNPRISNFSHIEESRKYNNQGGSNLGCYYVSNQLTKNYGLKANNYGSKRSLNLNILKSNSPMTLSRNASREHVAESNKCPNIESKLNEYILNSRRNSNMLRTKRSQVKPHQSYERPPINRNSSSFQISNSQYESQKYSRESARVSQRVEKVVPVVQNYFAIKKYSMLNKKKIDSRRNSSRRSSNVSSGDYHYSGVHLKNSFSEIAKEMETESIGYTYSKPVESEFKKEMKVYDIKNGEPGDDFSDRKNLNLPNIWNFLVEKKDCNVHKIEYIKSGIQAEITERMRGILVDWLIDVHKKFRLRTHTLFIAVNMIDRSLEKFYVKKADFQLLGITCLFIASKYEEIYPPSMSEYTYVCADAYKDQDLLNMEAKILNSLHFNLVFTSSFSLFKAYTEQKNIEGRPFHLALYLLHISLLNSSICRNNSCDLTAAAFLLISKLLKLENLTEETLLKDFDCNREKLRNLSQKMFVFLCEEKNSKLSASRRKFDQSKYMSVSAIQVSIRNGE